MTRLLRPATNWTVKMAHAIPEDGNRYELIDGELIVNGQDATHHQAAFLKLVIRLETYAREKGIGSTEMMLFDLDLEGPQIRRPDACIFRHPPGELGESEPLLAVDVLDPRYGRSDESFYGRYTPRIPVPEYWVLDVDNGSVWVTKPATKKGVEEIDGRLEWHPVAGIKPLVIELPEFFGSV